MIFITNQTLKSLLLKAFMNLAFNLFFI